MCRGGCHAVAGSAFRSLMAIRALIVWPDRDLAQQLESALHECGLSLLTCVHDKYPTAERLAELIGDSKAPTAVIVGLLDPERAVALLEGLRSSELAAVSVAADCSESAANIKAALRAGAVDYWTPPFDAETLRHGLAPLKQAVRTATERGRLVSFLPSDAGAGASMVALHAAHGVSTLNEKGVLLIDCDLQCGTTAFRLGLKPEFSLLDALAHNADIDELWDRLTTSWRGLDVLAGPETGTTFTHSNLAQLPAVLDSALLRYRWVVADLPAGLYPACEQVLLDSESVHVVCTSEVTSLHMARRRVSDLLALGLERERIRLVVNRADALNAIASQEIERAVGVEIDWTLVNDFRAVSDAAMRGGLVENGTELGGQLAALARRISGLEEPPPEHAASAWRRILAFR